MSKGNPTRPLRVTVSVRKSHGSRMAKVDFDGFQWPFLYLNTRKEKACARTQYDFGRILKQQFTVCSVSSALLV